MQYMREIYNCYFDESGCDGFLFSKGSTPWFFVSAVVCKVSVERDLRVFVDEILQKHWVDQGHQPPEKKNLHWCKIAENKKLPIISDLNLKDFMLFSSGFWKPKISKSSRLREPAALFKYASKFLLERISWYLSSCNGWGNLIFSKRGSGQLSHDDFVDYLEHVVAMSGYSTSHSILPLFDISSLKIDDSSDPYSKNLRMLKIADFCASSLGEAFNPHPQKGTLNPANISQITDHFYMVGPHLLSNGLKLFPLNGRVPEFSSEYPFVGQWCK